MSFIRNRTITRSLAQVSHRVSQRQFTKRLLSTPPVQPTPTPSSPPPNLPPPPLPRQSRWRGFLQTLGRVTLFTIVTASGTFYYITQKDRHPGPQLPFDPEKKTVVVLGSGWGASSLIKGLDTTDYNVVSTHTCISRSSQLDMIYETGRN
jgi:NADH:ubiquinone reductase (non-electrogenic)